MKFFKSILLILLLMFDASNGQTNGLQEVFGCDRPIMEVIEAIDRPKPKPANQRVLLITPQEEYLYER